MKKFLAHWTKISAGLLSALTLVLLLATPALALDTPSGGWTHALVQAQLATTNNERNNLIEGDTAGNINQPNNPTSVRFTELNQDLRELNAMDQAYGLIENNSTDINALTAARMEVQNAFNAGGYPDGSSQINTRDYFWNALGQQANTARGTPQSLEVAGQQGNNSKQNLQAAGVNSQKEAADRQARNNSACDRGFTNGWGLGDTKCWLELLANFTMWIVWLFSWLLWAANELFNVVMELSVRKFNTLLNSEAIKTTWSLARDLMNVSLFFVLLYAALGLVFNLKNIDGKRLVSNVIVVALLVNFSFFFTGVVIKASNTVANFLYSRASNGEVTTLGAPDITTPIWKSMLINPKGATDEPGQYDQPYTLGKILSNFVSKILLVVITAFVLLAGAIMFFVRMIKLLLYAALSPLAFLGLTVPALKGKAKGWVDGLINMCIFPVVFLLFLTAAMTLARTRDAWWSSSANESFGASLLSGLVVGIIVNGLLIAGLAAASGAGMAGAKWASDKLGSLGGWAKGKIGQNTLGRIGYSVSQRLSSDKGQSWVARNPRLGNALKSFSENVAKNSYGGAKGTNYKKTVEETAKRVTSFDKPEQQAEFIRQMGRPSLLGLGNRQIQQAAFEKLDAKGQVSVINAAKTAQSNVTKDLSDQISSKRLELEQENTALAQEIATENQAYDNKTKELEAAKEQYEKLPTIAMSEKAALQEKQAKLEQEKEEIAGRLANLKNTQRNISPKAQALQDEITRLEKAKQSKEKEVAESALGKRTNVLARLQQTMRDKSEKKGKEFEKAEKLKKRDEEKKTIKDKIKNGTATEPDKLRLEEIEEEEREENREQQKKNQKRLDDLEAKTNGNKDGGDKKEDKGENKDEKK